MTAFRYVAYAKRGDRTSGAITASSRAEALGLLAKQGLVIASLEPEADAKHGWRFGQSGLPLSALAQLTRQLANLSTADIPMVQALRMIAAQQRHTNPRVSGLVDAIAERLSGGGSLAEACAVPQVGMPGAACAIIEAGAVSGRSTQALGVAADYLEQRLAMRDSVRSALLYPSILLITALASLMLITMVLVPVLLPLFQDSGAQPPFILRMLAGIADTTAAYWPQLLAGLGLIALAMLLLMRAPIMRRRLDRVRLWVPLFGRLSRDLNAITFCRTLGALLDSGVAAPEALSLAAGSVSNSELRESVLRAGALVSAGDAISAALSRSPYWPPAMIEFAHMGEQTGRLGTMLLNYATFVQAEVSQRIATLTAALGPTMTIGIGLFIGTVVVTIMQSILGINELALR